MPYHLETQSAGQRVRANVASHGPPPSHARPPQIIDVHTIHAIQQLAGNKVVAELLGTRLAARERLDPGSRATRIPHAVQRKIGFEIETGIPFLRRSVGRKSKQHYWHDPGDPGGRGDLEIGLVNDVKLTVDHLPGHQHSKYEPFDDWPIVELVTNPVPDNETNLEFDGRVRDWISLLNILRREAASAPPPVSTVALRPNKSRFIGVPGNQRGPDPERVGPQATVGIPLARISDFMHRFSQISPGALGQRGQDVLRFEAAGEAPTVADRVMDTVRQQIRRSPPGIKYTEQQQATGLIELRALLVLASNILISTKKVTSGYLKNRSHLFSKTKLSDLRTGMVQRNPWSAYFLYREPFAAAVKRDLLLYAHRRPSDVMIEGDDDEQDELQCGPWLDEVFAGVDDKWFEGAKSPWTKPIGPDQVGGGSAAVIELRQLGLTFTSTGKLTLSNPEGLREYLHLLFAAYQTMK